MMIKKKKETVSPNKRIWNERIYVFNLRDMVISSFQCETIYAKRETEKRNGTNLHEKR